MRLFSRTLRALAPLLALVLGAPALADGVDIAHLVPPRTFLVANVTDCTKLRTAFEKSELGALWREPGVKAFVDELTKDEAEHFAKFLTEVGIKADDLKMPTGH